VLSGGRATSASSPAGSMNCLSIVVSSIVFWKVANAVGIDYIFLSGYDNSVAQSEINPNRRST